MDEMEIKCELVYRLNNNSTPGIGSGSLVYYHSSSPVRATAPLVAWMITLQNKRDTAMIAMLLPQHILSKGHCAQILVGVTIHTNTKQCSH